MTLKRNIPFGYHPDVALRLKHGIFIHFPKTGGVWATMLLTELGLVVEPLIEPHCSLKDVLSKHPDLASLKSFCFVRHPFSWYQSFWAFRCANGWGRDENLLDTCRAPTFQEFIRNVVKRCPGHLSAHLKELTQGVTYIGRFEALRESMIAILSVLGESFSYEAVYAHPPENVSPKDPVIAGRYTPELLDLLYKAETYAFTEFGYGMEPHVSP